ncbi:MAG: protein-L-isoaspartate O-methyltransferase family protein [Pseudomonadota bacterium]
MDIEAARQQMIEQQIRAWEVLDPRVLEALARVPREEFAPAAYREVAFADTQIPLPCGQSMLAPKLEGRILQALELVPGNEVLEIGTGSGFFAACLVELGGHVRSLEIHPELAELGRANLRANGYASVAVETADALAWTPQAAAGRGYDVIVLTASLPVYDARFEKLLAPGGRLFAVVGQGSAMEALLVTRAAGTQFARTELFETSIAPLVGAPRPSPFVF